ncbi:hypothetical protein OJF2_66880 [Aquisphaera giovannonii]|uniref:Uncharacterized protein n=1 Tax=Aquisphaera giovannonii TaxID=406548 RepID=A0A5B9WDW3_9BACT|nr:hypothetical protein [Aquisphaera giovannonii]QEH38090.1 hypothetical protein OJF2_66880 [Aquisphaera giovannonii]
MPRHLRRTRLTWIALAAIMGMAWSGAATACSMDSGSGCCCVAATPEKIGCCSKVAEEPPSASSDHQVAPLRLIPVEARSCNAYLCGGPAPAPGDRPRPAPGSVEGSKSVVPCSLAAMAGVAPWRADRGPDEAAAPPDPAIPIYLRTLRLIF